MGAVESSAVKSRERAPGSEQAPQEGKQVSFVELYLDLVFVLAIGQLAHLIIDTPSWHSVWVALGLFIALWWTWIGFTILYNRHGTDDAWERLLFLVASAPVGAAAVAVAPASTGHPTAFAISLAVTRVLLAIGNLRDDDPDSSVGDALRLRTARIFVVSAVLFTISIWVPGPFDYLLWAAAYISESRVTLGSGGRWRATADDPSDALDAHHFAERFGLFIIILLGEVVVEAGAGAADGNHPSTAAWFALIAAMALAGTFWWSYFAAAAEIDFDRLERSGGSPAVARAIFAAGHMLPAFALLIAAGGVGLLLRHDPPQIAYWLTCIGAGLYVAGTSSYISAHGRWRRLARTAAQAGTYAFGALHAVVSPPLYLWLIAIWVAGNVALAALFKPPSADTASAQPLAIDEAIAAD
jgi:low temperature requirement protein LtrA